MRKYILIKIKLGIINVIQSQKYFGFRYYIQVY